MKWLTFRYAGSDRVGFIKHDQVVPFEDYSSLQTVIENYSVVELVQTAGNIRSDGIDLEQIEILSPLPHPVRNIFCLGMNYRDHLAELGASAPPKPIYFTKTGPTTADKASVAIPGMTKQLDYEAELAIVIGQSGKHLTRGNALDHVFGYTVANDLSARDIQFERGQWFFGKSFDGCCPLGPVIMLNTTDQEPDWLIQTTVNGQVRQQSRTSQLLFGIRDILIDLSQDLTLLPGDIILTGTPGGVGMGLKPPQYLKSGDVVVCSIEQIGQLETRIISQT